MRPILFSTDNVRKILDGKKTMTRRVVEPQVESIERLETVHAEVLYDFLINCCPYGQVGSKLWVQEKWCGRRDRLVDCPLRYLADYPDNYDDAMKMDHTFGLYEWQPATNMPYWAARLKLLITDVRVKRLHSITDYSACKEGVLSMEEFRKQWNSINEIRGYGWDMNPLVYVIVFEKIV